MIIFAVGLEITTAWSLKVAIASAVAYLFALYLLLVGYVETNQFRKHRIRSVLSYSSIVIALAACWFLLLPDRPLTPKDYASAVWEQAPQPLTGFLQFDRIEILRDYSYLEAGKQFGGNFYSRNPGPTRVFNTFGYSKAFVVRAEDQADRKVQYLFEQELAPQRENYLAGKIKGPEQGIGQGLWTTILTKPLTAEEVTGVTSGSVRIYFVTWLAWSDQQGRKDSAYDCRWLQGQTLPAPYRKEDIIWHYCQ